MRQFTGYMSRIGIPIILAFAGLVAVAGTTLRSQVRIVNGTGQELQRVQIELPGHAFSVGQMERDGSRRIFYQASAEGTLTMTAKLPNGEILKKSGGYVQTGFFGSRHVVVVKPDGAIDITD